VTAAQPYKLVIFDFDGTLSDSGEWFLSILDDLSERFRFRRVVDRDEVERLRRRPTREVIQHLGIPGWKLPLIARHVRARFRENACDIRTFDGVRAMLQTLADAGIRMMLCSSNGEANVRAVLGPDAARFEAYFCGSGLFGKVAKFRRAIKASGLAPSAILAIGDETRDIDAARAVGIGAGAVLWGYANPDLLIAMRPDITFASPADIVAHLA
jgi:phosphoglycolate phosphatase